MNCRIPAVLALVTLGALHVSAKNGPDSLLPAEIARFYRACNSLSALSTPEERSRIAAAAGHADSLMTPRFSYIRSLIQQIEGRILQNDPGMVIPTGPRLSSWTCEAIVDIRKVRTDLDRIFVELRSRPVHANSRGILISRLDRQGRDDLEARASEAIGRLIEPAPTEAAEIHHWIRRGDTWFVSDVKVRLVRPIAGF